MMRTAAPEKPPQYARDAPGLAIECALPDRALCGNGTAGKFARGRLVKAQRAAARLAAQEARKSYDATMLARHGSYGEVLWPMGRVVVDVHVRRPAFWAARRLDDDNLIRGLKATIDGLTDARIWSDDRQVRWGAITWEAAQPGEHGVTLTVAHVAGSHWSWLED